MSAWTDRILQEFPADLARFWIACDPDDLLLDGRILYDLRERGFEVLPFEDSIAFRTDYEERYRAAWDQGVEGTARALILQLRGTDINDLPWDYVRMGRKVSLSLADLFPRVSYSVIRHLDPEHHEALFLAQNKHASQPLGEGATKDFILTHIFRFSPYLLSRPEDFWREVLRLHFRGAGLPEMLAHHVAAILRDASFGDLPMADLLQSKSFMVRTVQDAWHHFLSDYGVYGESNSTDAAGAKLTVSIPFDHPDVRVIVDTMFLEGTLQPVRSKASSSDIPKWLKVGLVDAPHALGDLVSEGITAIASSLPDAEATHRDWIELAGRLGEVISRFNSLGTEIAEPIKKEMSKLRSDADDALKEWLIQHYADLPSLPAARAPVMVHHVPRYLALRRNAGEDRIALLVFDGLALDQWFQIRERLAARMPGFSAEEGGCFAWLPTLTSVSRQALFSGLKPREFASSIENTSKEPSLWSRFWQENGLRKHEIVYQKGLKRIEQLAALEEAIAQPSTKVAGIVVDMVDEIVHGATLGKRGIAGQIDTWCDTGFVEKLFMLLAEHGYQIYLTADHGNVEAEGIGRISEGVISETRGERVRTYRNETLAGSVPPEIDAFRFHSSGLPADFIPVYADTRKAFVSEGEQIVAHGGISVEELIVPFIKISIKRPA